MEKRIELGDNNVLRVVSHVENQIQLESIIDETKTDDRDDNKQDEGLLKSGRQAKSLVWSYFVDRGNVPPVNEARCKICSSNVKRDYSSTNGLWSHLKREHKEEYVYVCSVRNKG